MFSPSISPRFLRRHNLYLSCLFIFSIGESRRERLAPLCPVLRSIWILGRSDQFFRSNEIVEFFDIFEFPSDFVRKNELHSIAWMQINSLNHILKVSLMNDPSPKYWVIRYVPKSSRPIMIGRLAGKVRYPALQTIYKDYFGWDKPTLSLWQNELTAATSASSNFVCSKTEALDSYAT